jgi:hypothetical protein
MTIINKETQETFDFLDGISFEDAVAEIMSEVDRINSVYPEEHLVINKNDLVLA